MQKAFPFQPTILDKHAKESIMKMESVILRYDYRQKGVFPVPKKRILYAGSAEICFAIDAPFVPESGETLLSDGKYAFSPSGHGMLTAIAAGRLGYDAVLCGRVGDDYYGDRLLGLCRNEGLHVSNITTDRELQTGLSVTVNEKKNGKRTIRFPGANTHISGTQIEDALSCYPDAVAVSMDLPRSTVFRAAASAALQGIPLFLDAAGIGSEIADYPFEKINKAEILFIDEKEADFLADAAGGNEEKKKMACYSLCKRFNVKYVILRLGKKGCFLYDGKYFSAIVSADADPLDEDGAVEAFTAALIGEYLETENIEKAAKFANNIAALTASRIGGYSSLPTKEEASYLK